MTQIVASLGRRLQVTPTLSKTSLGYALSRVYAAFLASGQLEYGILFKSLQRAKSNPGSFVHLHGYSLLRG